MKHDVGAEMGEVQASERSCAILLNGQDPYVFERFHKVALLCPARPRSVSLGSLRLLGPAFAVGIGYVDPGNWASDLAAGSYRFTLLWAILLANAIAIVLQIAVTRVTIASGSDFATLISRRWPRLSGAFWFVFQGAAMATDVAEFTGIVLGSQLLFGFSIVHAVLLGLSVIALLLFVGGRRRTLDAVMIGAILAIGFVYVYLVSALHPDPGAIARGLAVPAIPDGGALLIIVAIVGATVMPHNLFLHSALINKRCEGASPEERRTAGRFFTGETLVALNLAAVINGAILVVGACLKNGEAASIQTTFGGLAQLTGSSGSALFGIALLISGIAASLGATLSGDYIFKAFSPVRVAPPLRRAVTVLPAAALLLAHFDPTSLLLWSQVALCLVLPAALLPLLGLVRKGAGSARRPRSFFALCAFATGLCVILDAALLVQTLHS